MRDQAEAIGRATDCADVNSLKSGQSVNVEMGREPSDGCSAVVKEKAATLAASDPLKGCSFGKGKKKVQRTLSCLLGRTRSVLSGPWSLEWLGDQNHAAAGVISSSKKQFQSTNYRSQDQKVIRKKVETVLKHPVVSLKKVARMPSKDRTVVLKELVNVVETLLIKVLRLLIMEQVMCQLILRTRFLMIGGTGLFYVVTRRWR